MTIVSEFSFWCVIRDKHSFLATFIKAGIAKGQDFYLLTFQYQVTYGPFRHGDNVNDKMNNNNLCSNLRQVVCKIVDVALLSSKLMKLRGC
jgi:hypothetical protein